MINTASDLHNDEEYKSYDTIKWGHDRQLAQAQNNTIKHGAD